MSARRGTTQHNDECRAFVEFAVSNCIAADGKIYCPCKYCRNNQRHSPDYALAHLIKGRGMTSGYSLWYMYSETARGSAVLVQFLSHHSVTDSVAGSIEQGESLEQGSDMHAMLCDAFGVHDVSKAVNSQPQVVNEGTAAEDALKYYELLKTADKPIHTSTKHSKLSAIVHMYNLKCVGGISNKILSDILETYESVVASL
jgi:hypothetical protein